MYGIGDISLTRDQGSKINAWELLTQEQVAVFGGKGYNPSQQCQYPQYSSYC